MKPMFYGALTAGAIVFLTAFGGKIEGRLFPVTGQVNILQTQADGSIRTRFWGELERLRQCSFVRIEWRLGIPGASAVADLVFEEGAKVRGSGLDEFGPWVVQLTPDQLLNRSFAIVYHRCHPFWLTETVFYP